MHDSIICSLVIIKSLKILPAIKKQVVTFWEVHRLQTVATIFCKIFFQMVGAPQSRTDGQAISSASNTGTVHRLEGSTV